MSATFVAARAAVAGDDEPALLLRRLDALPVGGLHLAVAMLCGFGFAIDLMELSMGGVLSTVFSARPYSLSSNSLAWLLGSLYVGAIVGAPCLGWVADRIGLARVLAISMLWLAATSLLAAFSHDAGQLALARLLSGLALGAYPPLMIAYLSDIAPPGKRVGLVFLACAIGYVAPPAAIFIVRAMATLHPMGLEAWRWPFVVGGLASCLAALGFRQAPEAPRWLIARLRLTQAQDVVARFETQRKTAPGQAAGAGPASSHGMADGVAPVAFSRRAMMFVMALYFLNPWSTVAFPLITGPLLLARGLGVSDTLFYVGLAAFGPSLGMLAGAAFVDRMPRRGVLAASGVLLLLALILFFTSHTAWGLAAGVIGFGVFTALYMPAMTVYGAEQFPQTVRSTASSGAWAVNRIAAAGAPFVFLPLVRSGRDLVVVGVIVTTLILSLVLIAVYNPQRRRIV